jgi:tetratricopeptide (TPR) repeat protein
MQQTRPKDAQRSAVEILSRGMKLQRMGDFRGAKRCYQLVLRDNPTHADALNLMGTLAIEASRMTIAIDYFRRAAAIRPRHAGYLNNLGKALVSNGNPEEGLKNLQAALSVEPHSLDVLINLSRAYRKLGKIEEVFASIDRALALSPNNAAALTVRGDVMSDLGRVREAERAYRAALSSDSRYISAIHGLVAAITIPTDDPLVEIIRGLCTNAAVKNRNRAVLHHALGKICNDAQQYDEAFVHFNEGKKLSKSDFSLKQHRDRYDSMKRAFSLSFFRERAGFGIESELPVFVIGMPRSGTTLVEQIIASHPCASGAGELTVLENIAEELKYHSSDADQFARSVMAIRKDDSRRLAQRYLGILRTHSAAALRIVDKMPHNFQLLGLIGLLLPRAKIIHCRRDALDTCVSCFTHQLVGHGYSNDLENLGFYYREYADLMDHWASVLPNRIHTSQYEELIFNQEASSRGLVDFIGLDWTDACLNYASTKRLVGTYSRWQVRRPIYSSSVGAWKRYEKHLQPLISALGGYASL